MERKKIAKKTKSDCTSDNYTAVLLEDMRDEIKLLAENQISMRDEIKLLAEGQAAMQEDIRKLVEGLNTVNHRLYCMESKVGSLESKVGSLESSFQQFKEETRENFQAVLEYLSRLEDEVMALKADIRKLDQDKVSREEFEQYAGRVERLEQEISVHKARLATARKVADKQ